MKNLEDLLITKYTSFVTWFNTTKETTNGAELMQWVVQILALSIILGNEFLQGNF